MKISVSFDAPGAVYSTQPNVLGSPVLPERKPNPIRGYTIRVTVLTPDVACAEFFSEKLPYNPFYDEAEPPVAQAARRTPLLGLAVPRAHAAVRDQRGVVDVDVTSTTTGASGTLLLRGRVYSVTLKGREAWKLTTV